MEMLSTLDTLKAQLVGIVFQGEEVAVDIEAFIKVSGIKEQKAKLDMLISDLEASQETVKENLKVAAFDKSKAMAPVMKGVGDAITGALPEGTGVFEITEDKKVVIGWKINGKTKQYKGLSGGEEKAYNSALLNALGCEIIYQESAEMDDERTIATMRWKHE